MAAFFLLYAPDSIYTHNYLIHIVSVGYFSHIDRQKCSISWTLIAATFHTIILFVIFGNISVSIKFLLFFSLETKKHSHWYLDLDW